MNLIHETVTHKRFGSGSVTEFDGRILTVFFDAYGFRSFSYPTAFDGFLKADNPAVQSEALEAIRLKRESEAASRAEKQIETARAAASARRRPSAAKSASAARKGAAPQS